MDAYNRGRFDFSKDNILLRLGQATRLGALLMASALSVVAVQYAFEWLMMPGVQEWIACDQSALIGASLQEKMRRDMGQDAAYWCSTHRVTREMPCMCCVGEHCWRDATVVKNSTVMATMWDHVADGRRLRRRIPAFVIVSYDKCDSAETYVRQEKGETVGDLFRALELLHNLEPDGIDEQQEL